MDILDEGGGEILDEGGSAILDESSATFPEGILGMGVELNLGADGWTDITGYVQLPPTSPYIEITWGRQNETTSATPGSCPLNLDNLDGRFSPDDPTGTWYGLFGQNTPARISVPGAAVTLRIEDDAVSYASCPDASRLHLTGDIDVRIEISPSNYMPATLAGQWDGGGNHSWALLLYADSTLQFWWADSSNNGHFVNSTAPIPLGHTALRVTLQVSTGTVTFYTASSISGSWTQLGTAVVSGATSLQAGTGGITVGYSTAWDESFGYQALQGRIYAFELLSGIGGTVVASPAFTAQTAGATSFTDAQSNTWTVQGTATLDGRSYRMHGEVSAIPATMDPTLHDIWAPVTISGILRRLQQGQAQVMSALKRYYTTAPASLAVAAYWPAEDGAGSTQVSSGLPGGTPMSLAGSPTFTAETGSQEADTNFPCSASLPTLGLSIWTGVVPDSVTWTDNVVRFCIYEEAGDIGTSNVVLLRINTSGTIARADLFYQTGGLLGLTVYNAAGTQLATTGGVSFGIDGVPLRVSVDLIADGANVTCQIQTLQPGSGSGETYSVTCDSATIGPVTSVQVNAAALSMPSVEFGQVSVQGVWDSLFDMAEPLNAWAGETDGTRFARLCQENGIPVRIWGPPDAGVIMGYQPIDTIANLLQYCEDAGRGFIYEPRETLGLGYCTLAALCTGAGPDASLDFSLGEVSPPLLPTRDDQQVRNDIVLTRNNGATVQQQIETGPLSVLPPAQGGVGDYSTSLTLYNLNDADLTSIARWMAWVGTAPLLRFPSVMVDLASTDENMQDLLPDVRDLPPIAHLAITSTSAPLPPGTIDELALGGVEQIGDFVWRMKWNCVPQTPYQVALAGTGATDSARAATDGATLVSAVSSTATTLSVATTDSSSPLWDTTSGDDPFYITIAGEEIEVTAVSGSSSPQTFTVTRSVNGVSKSQAAGAAVTLADTPTAALAGIGAGT